jgi:hypothetical protein
MKNAPIDLRAALRAGDPAAGETLDSREVARLRAAVEAAAEEAATPSPWPWRAIWAAAALTGLAIALALRAPQQPVSPRSAAAVVPRASSEVKNQQLQFETPDGVRIVWVLSPNVHL